MFQLENVLFPVDFSSRCRGAARLLDALHANFQLNVTLVHVLPPPHMEYSMADLGGGIFQEYTKAREDQARKDLEYFLDDELKHYKLNRVLLEGDPARRLVAYAHDHKMNLVVMPIWGMSPSDFLRGRCVSGWWRGCVGDRLISTRCCWSFSAT